MSRYPIENPEFFLLQHIQDYPRSFLAAEVSTPKGKIDCCSLHTEVCGGRRANIHSYLYTGITLRIKQLSFTLDELGKRDKKRCATKGVQSYPTIIAGDLNTICDKLIRLSPVHCTDKLRFLSIGTSEARWLEDHFWRAKKTQFFDYFDKDKDVTFVNSLYSGKLDWLLLKDLKGGNCKIGQGNESDHQWVSMNITL